MTLEERTRAVEAALKQIEHDYGMRVFAAVEPEALNAGIVQVRAVLKAEPIPGWTPPPSKDGRPDEK